MDEVFTDFMGDRYVRFSPIGEIFDCSLDETDPKKLYDLQIGAKEWLEQTENKTKVDLLIQKLKGNTEN